VRRARLGWRGRLNAWQNARQRLARLRPSLILARHREVLRDWQRRLRDRIALGLQGKRQSLNTLRARLQLLGPDNVLARGYSITLDEVTGRVLRAASETRPGRRIRTRLKSGEVRSLVEESEPGAPSAPGTGES